MQARDVMTTGVLSVTSQTEIGDAARLLHDNRISGVPVIDDGKLVGIISEGDLMRRAESGTERRPSWWLNLLAQPHSRAVDYLRERGRRVADVMSRNVVTVTEDEDLRKIAETMERRDIKRVPVVRDGAVVGIISRANLMHGLIVRGDTKAPASDDRSIRETIDAELHRAGIKSSLANIVVSDGTVHLLGMAHSDEQRRAIQAAAERTAGAGRVVNELRVVPIHPAEYWTW